MLAQSSVCATPKSLRSGPSKHSTRANAVQSQTRHHAVNSSQIVSFGNDSKALLAWDSGNRSLVLAFSASPTDNSSLTASVNSLVPVGFLREAFNGNPPSVNPAALTPFTSLLSNITADGGAINNVTSGEFISCSRQ